MTFALTLSFFKIHADTVLAVWLIFEQLLAANKNIKANSTAQLVLNLVDNLVKKNAGK
jgi:hypothetical protein